MLVCVVIFFLVTLPNNSFSSIQQTVKESKLLGYMFRYKNICIFSLGIISHKSPREFFSVFVLNPFFPVSYNI